MCWRASIDPKKVTPTIAITEPGAITTTSGHTTHVSIVDIHGNVEDLSRNGE